MAHDVAYVGQRRFYTIQSVNLNAVDFDTAFLQQNLDPTLPASTTPGATALQTNLLRSIRGYAGITQQWDRGWRTYHSIQVSFQRRVPHGVSLRFPHTDAPLHQRQARRALRHHRARPPPPRPPPPP